MTVTVQFKHCQTRSEVNENHLLDWISTREEMMRSQVTGYRRCFSTLLLSCSFNSIICNHYISSIDICHCVLETYQHFKGNANMTCLRPAACHAVCCMSHNCIIYSLLMHLSIGFPNRLSCVWKHPEHWQLICPLNEVNHLLSVIDLKDEAFDMMLHEGKYIRKPHHQQQTCSLVCVLYEIITVLDKQIEIRYLDLLMFLVLIGFIERLYLFAQRFDHAERHS